MICLYWYYIGTLFLPLNSEAKTHNLGKQKKTHFIFIPWHVFFQGNYFPMWISMLHCISLTFMQWVIIRFRLFTKMIDSWPLSYYVILTHAQQDIYCNWTQMLMPPGILWALNMLVFLPDSFNTSLIHLAIVAVVPSLWGFTNDRKTLDEYFPFLFLKGSVRQRYSTRVDFGHKSTLSGNVGKNTSNFLPGLDVLWHSDIN